MKKINSRFLIATLVLVITCLSISAQELSQVVPEEVGLSSERLQRLSAVFQWYVDDGKLSGIRNRTEDDVRHIPNRHIYSA